jgi:hypothetical protein
MAWCGQPVRVINEVRVRRRRELWDGTNDEQRHLAYINPASGYCPSFDFTCLMSPSVLKTTVLDLFPLEG